ncbi:MAG: hypothetical protein WC374_08405 [Phycisphaerae bacterium]|jgi:hypothetical protein
MKKSALTKKQMSVIDEMFAGELDISAILEKHKISPRLYDKWLADDGFKAEFTRRIEWLNLQSQALIARYASFAAAKLVALTDSEKEEVRRKACLDIISLPRLDERKSAPQNSDAADDSEPYLHPQIASRLLEALAKEK